MLGFTRHLVCFSQWHGREWGGCLVMFGGQFFLSLHVGLLWVLIWAASGSSGGGTRHGLFFWGGGLMGGCCSLNTVLWCTVSLYRPMLWVFIGVTLASEAVLVGTHIMAFLWGFYWVSSGYRRIPFGNVLGTFFHTISYGQVLWLLIGAASERPF